MSIDDLRRLAENIQNVTKGELNGEILALVKLMEAQQERINRTLTCMANIISDIPGSRETEKQLKYWEILEKRLK